MAYQGQRIIFNGEVVKVDQVTEDTKFFTRVQLSDPFPTQTRCLKNGYIMPVVLYFNNITFRNPGNMEIGTVVVVEGIGDGALTTKTENGMTITTPKLIGHSLELDTYCTVTVQVITDPPNIYIYLDRYKEGVSSPTAIFENVCPGPHTLSALSVFRTLVGEKQVNVSANSKEWTTLYDYMPASSSSSSGGTTYYNWPMP